MLTFTNLSMRNIMSFGNAPEVIDLNKDNLTLVLGENLDKGEDSGERNGVGKSSIIMALHYALFGMAIGNKIKKPNLINKTNKKDLEVILDIEKDGNSYRIRRTRNPTNLEFFVNDDLVNVKDQDEGQGEMGDTQVEINRVLGITPDMFNQSILLSTYVEPFLSHGPAMQRKLIEELLGITQLSEKADRLKDMLRDSKNALEQEEFKIKTLKETNTKLKAQHTKTHNELQRKSNSWEEDHQEEFDSLQTAIDNLSDIDINSEIKLHEELNEWMEVKRSNDEIKSKKKRIKSDKQRHERVVLQSQDRLDELAIDLKAVEENKCHTCGQAVHADDYESLKADLMKKISSYEDTLQSELEALAEVIEQEENLAEVQEQGSRPETFYDDLKEAYKHKSNLKELKASLRNLKKAENPYKEQIESQPEAPLHEIDYSFKDDVQTLKDHQEFLYKILTNRESAVRKQIVTQNLSYLNNRLEHYLDKLGLPHEVEFQSDMSTEINMMGNDFDFASLSRGERARLTLGLTFAFRDVWESLNTPMNLLFIDEVLDNGIDPAGLEAALKTIKQLGRTGNKNIFIVSHREELIARVSNVLTVTKEGGFSSLNWKDTNEWI